LSFLRSVTPSTSMPMLPQYVCCKKSTNSCSVVSPSYEGGSSFLKKIVVYTLCI
jgi:hypothetical protein